MKLFFVALLVMFCNITMSQNCNYTFLGQLKDFHDNSAITQANIFINELNKNVVSDNNGKFKIENLCKGTLTLTISHIGCETKTVSYTISNDEFKIITLEHHIETLTEVTVSGSSKLEQTSIQNNLTKQTISNFSDKTLGDALKTVSGVSTLNTGNSIVKPMIHGLHSSRLLIINNNVRLFDQEWGDEHAPNIDINTAGKIEVIKGANTLMYGSDAIGGLIRIKPENYAVTDSLFGSTTMALNTNGRGGNINSELVKTYSNGFYAKAQASYKLFGDFEAANYNLSNTGIRSINASISAGYKSFEKGFDAYYSVVKNKISILRAAHIGNVGDLVNAIESEQPNYIGEFSYNIDNPYQDILHHLGKVEAYKRYRGIGKLSVQYDFQINRRKEFDRRRGQFRNRPAIDLRLFTTALQPNLKIDAYQNLNINTGFLLRYQQNNAVSGTGAQQLIPDYDKYDSGVYATTTYNLDDFSEISTGFRYDFSRIEAEKRYRVNDWDEVYNYDELFPQFNTGIIESSEYITLPKFSFHNISASLGYNKRFNNHFEFIFNYGLASRMPNPSELFSDGLHHSAARIEVGKLTMQKEVGHKFIAALERKNENFGFTISPYFRHINNFIQLIPTATKTTIRGAFVQWEYNQVQAQIFGIDVDINKKLGQNFNYNGRLSWLQGNNLTEANALIQMPATNFSNTINYTNKKYNQLTLGITQHTVLQQTRFPDYNFYTFDPVLQQQVYVDISSTPLAYTLFNFNGNATFKAFKNSTLNIAFNIENIFNVAYRENLNRLRFFADDVGRNFNINLKLNY